MIGRRSFGTRDGARPEAAHFIGGWYDPHRRHSGLVCESPICLEARARERAADVSARADAPGGLRAPQTSGPPLHSPLHQTGVAPAAARQILIRVGT